MRARFVQWPNLGSLYLLTVSRRRVLVRCGLYLHTFLNVQRNVARKIVSDFGVRSLSLIFLPARATSWSRHYILVAGSWRKSSLEVERRIGGYCRGCFSGDHQLHIGVWGVTNGMG